MDRLTSGFPVFSYYPLRKREMILFDFVQWCQQQQHFETDNLLFFKVDPPMFSESFLRPNFPPTTSPFAFPAELDMMFSGYDTFLSPPPSCRASTSSSYALYNTVCPRVCVSVCVSQGDIVADCLTGHLFACFQSRQPFCDYTLFWQVGINEGARPLSVCLFCLSVLGEAQALHRTFRACLLTWWLPWEQPDSGRLCSRLLRGL